MRFAMLLAAGCLLAGCSSFGSANPVSWWHKQQGGKIAEERPAPPGADQAFPNLATVPPRPAAPDQAALSKLTASLVADRTNAQHAAQSAPIADPSSPSASPGLFGIGSAPPPPPAGATPVAKAGAGAPSGPTVASASLAAVSAPPPAAPPSSPAVASPAASSSAASSFSAPQPAPRRSVQSAPLENPPLEAAPRDNPSTVAASPAPPAASAPAPADAERLAAAAQPQPALPAAPPPRPAAAGVPPAALPSPSPMPSAGAKSADIAFVTDTASLTSAAADEVKAFAAQRGNAVVGITGYGDATGTDPTTQTTALNLGLARAQAIMDILKSAGVPGNAIRVSAEASGRGASLHLLQ